MFTPQAYWTMLKRICHQDNVYKMDLYGTRTWIETLARRKLNFRFYVVTEPAQCTP